MPLLEAVHGKHETKTRTPRTDPSSLSDARLGGADFPSLGACLYVVCLCEKHYHNHLPSHTQRRPGKSVRVGSSPPQRGQLARQTPLQSLFTHACALPALKAVHTRIIESGVPPHPWS